MSFLFGSVYLSVIPEISGSGYRPYFRRMSNSGVTSEAQIRYMLQWFGEFSELQREDFLPIITAARNNQPDLLASILKSLTCDEKPASLFQCRIKLFNEWYPTWTEEQQDRVIRTVSEMDPDFAAKLQDALQNGIKTNGHVKHIDDMINEIENQNDEEKPEEEEEEVSEAAEEESQEFYGEEESLESDRDM